MMWIVGKEGKPKHIVMLLRPPRKKLYRLTCMCRSRRKDGTCRYTDGIRPLIYLVERHRIRLEHPQLDDQLHPLPKLDLHAYELTERGRELVALGPQEEVAA